MKYQAIQYTGKNAHDVMKFLGCGHGDVLIMPVASDYIKIGYNDGTFKLYPMWWVLKRNDGAVKVLENISEVMDG